MRAAPDHWRAARDGAWLRAAVVGSFLLGLAFTAGSWGGRAPAGDDVMAHVVRADYAFGHIFNHGRLDGWFPRFMVGHQEFLLYGPAFTWLLGAIRLVTFGQLSTVGAYKVAGMVTYAAFPPAFAFLARSLGLSVRAAAVAAFLALAVNNDLGVGLHAVYSISLVPQQLGAVAFCVALGSIVRTVDDRRRRWIALGAVSLAVIAVSHLITGMVLLVFVALALPLILARARHDILAVVVRLAAMGAVSLALSAFWIVPFLAHHDLRGPVTTWATPPLLTRLGDIGAGRILFAPGLALLVAAGMVGALPELRKRPRGLVFVVIAPLAYLVVAHWSVAQWPGNEVTLQLANRGLGYAGALAMLPLAVGMGRAPARIAVAAAVVAAVVFTAHGRSEVKQAGRPSPALVQTAETLARVVPLGGRFATQRDFPAEITLTGVSHPDVWLAQRSARNTLNLFNAESSPSLAGFIAEQIGRQPAALLLTDMRRYGVTHIVTLRRETAEEYLATTGVALVSTVGGISTLEILDARPLRLVGGSAEHVTSVVSPDGTVPIAWSPKWHATRVLGSRRAESVESPDGLVAVRGATVGEEIRLDFRADRWDRIGALITGAAALATAIFGLRYFLSSSSWMSRRRSLTA